MGFTIAKPAVEHFPPLLLMLMVYGAIAFYVMAIRRSRVTTPWLSVLLIASCAVTIQGAMLFGALRELSATSTSLVLQMQVPFAVILGWLLLGETFDGRKILGTVIAMLGVITGLDRLFNGRKADRAAAGQ
jgi:O-acetylserine/cysteine efflux transporter